MTLSPAFSRALALTLLATLLFIIFSLVVAPLWNANQKFRERVRTNALQIARFERLLQEQPQIARRLAQIESATSQSLELFDGDSAAIIGAAVQDRVRKAVSAASGDQRSAQAMPVQEVAGHLQTSVRIVATIRSSHLIDLLHDLETGSPTILINELSLRVNTRGARRNDAQLGDDDPELTLNFVASGFAAAESRVVESLPATLATAITEGSSDDF